MSALISSGVFVASRMDFYEFFQAENDDPAIRLFPDRLMGNDLHQTDRVPHFDALQQLDIDLTAKGFFK